MARTVGAALRGRPFVEQLCSPNSRLSFCESVGFDEGAATEGRPYSTFYAVWLFSFVYSFTPRINMTRGNQSQPILAVIPARMGSSRFPGKPLAPLHGLSMIEHVFRRAKLCLQLDEVYVATCDAEIRTAAEAFGANVIMTSATHERATDRVAEAADHLDAEIIVMIQGDEPMITPEMIPAALAPIRSDPAIACVNLVHSITSQQEFIDSTQSRLWLVWMAAHSIFHVRRFRTYVLNTQRRKSSNRCV